MRLMKNLYLMDQAEQCTNEHIQNELKSLIEFGEYLIMVELIRGSNLTLASGEARNSLRKGT